MKRTKKLYSYYSEYGQKRFYTKAYTRSQARVNFIRTTGTGEEYINLDKIKYEKEKRS